MINKNKNQKTIPKSLFLNLYTNKYRVSPYKLSLLKSNTISKNKNISDKFYLSYSDNKNIPVTQQKPYKNVYGDYIYENFKKDKNNSLFKLKPINRRNQINSLDIADKKYYQMVFKKAKHSRRYKKIADKIMINAYKKQVFKCLPVEVQKDFNFKKYNNL